MGLSKQTMQRLLDYSDKINEVDKAAENLRDVGLMISGKAAKRTMADVFLILSGKELPYGKA